MKILLKIQRITFRNYNLTKEIRFYSTEMVSILKNRENINTSKSTLNTNTINNKKDDNYYNKDGKLKFLSYDKNGYPVVGINYYETLGVSDKANFNEIRKHYLLICKEYHPDKNEKYLNFFTNVCSGYDTLKDTERRAIYDDELSLQNNQVWITKFWKIRINIIYLFGISLLTYILSLNYDRIKSYINFYYCPLGHQKYNISSIKINEKNLELIRFVEIERANNKLKCIAEDDEYEYYIVKS